MLSKLIAIFLLATVAMAGPVKVLTAPARHPMKTGRAIKKAGKATGKAAKATAKAVKETVW